MTTNKTIVFDLDGTIVDFYGVDGWLNDIRNENTRPYDVAEPLYNMDILNAILDVLRLQGWTIAVTTWLAKGSTKEFDTKVRKAKIEWLKKHNFPYDEIHLVKYGTTKANCTRRLGGYQILVDDNAEIRQGWTLGSTIDANENILKSLADLAISA
jgi:phosphoglycolate phosphatase-like HAD superfamily hydrolase